ncbi:uncharacterized protein C2845_PM07G01290 [Panicum miliaceum]|uniref:DUF674 domain-containing protein n=1 Tax=Panicum miliaceum TaxID=4540 RepID=A0A3L6SRV3_PANMI|nr:uncharacterized protein C2845_PM07G01290 [Panicum miliaceum]
MSTTTRTLKMKLLIDTKANRVVFAEADKEVVDVLFSLLALPVASIVEMLGRRSMPGSFGNLYDSVAKLDYTYVVAGAEKGELLYPTIASSAASTSLSRSLLLSSPSPGKSKSFYKCSSYRSCSYVTDARGTRCPTCGCNMTAPLGYVSPHTVTAPMSLGNGH